MKWILAPLATVAAITIGYIVYSDRRENTANPLHPWFEAEDDAFLTHLPHPWSTTPPGWNR